ncbi:MAG: hypothetical protein R3E58_05410 [Phycisphaerae bacterium]|nr:hypothetical protein [Phycisphaerales bacterium]
MSQSARFFAPPVYAGMSGRAPTAPPRFKTGNINADISRRAQNTYLNAFNHPVALGMQYRALRDEDTNDSLMNMPEITDDIVTEAANHASHTVRLKRRIDAIREEQTKKAWELLREGQYHQSHQAFRMAGIGREEDVASAIGEFVSAVVDQQYRTAIVRLQGIMRHNPDMFDHRYPLDTILPSAKKGEHALSECAAIVTANPDSAEFAAIQAYLLWLDSDSPVKESAAIRAATRLKDEFRVSEYADFLDKMQKALESEEANDANEINPFSQTSKSPSEA